MASQLKSQDQLRPMKETFHSRLHSTVLPRLGTIRMESHHNLHTHAVDLDIQLLGNNRVLKERPPSISDEDNDALSHNYGQDTAIYCSTTSIGC